MGQGERLLRFILQQGGIFDMDTGLWEEGGTTKHANWPSFFGHLSSWLENFPLRGYAHPAWGLSYNVVDSLCFDLDLRRWIYSGYQDMLEEISSDFDPFVAVLDGRRIILIDTLVRRTVMVEREDGARVDPRTLPQSVHAFDIESGLGNLDLEIWTWTPLANLHAATGSKKEARCFTIKSDGGGSRNFVFIRGKEWAQLRPDGNWEFMPSLSRSNLSVALISGKGIFTGSLWVLLVLARRAQPALNAWSASDCTKHSMKAIDAVGCLY